jgi:SAM-dependent methyltransferase
MRRINLEAERAFQNRQTTDGYVREAQSKFYWATLPSINKHLQRTCEVIAGKHVLEIGCASGIDAVTYAQHARHYVGVDISDEAIGNARGLAISNAEFLCADGHQLPMADQSVDCVIANSLLHHLDLHQALKEVSRVLKAGGLLVFREPLGTNPLFRLYRRATPEARTSDERPLTLRDISLIRESFVLEEEHWFGYLCLVSAFVRSSGLRSLLTMADQLLSRTPHRLWFWQFAGVARKLEVATK